MKIKSPKDFWAGLMFIASGLFFAVWALEFYQMGTAVRMGPAYFPTMLGFLLVALGLIVLAQSVMMLPEAGSAKFEMPFNIVDLVITVAIYVVLVWIAVKLDISSDYGILVATLVISVLTVLFRPGARALVLVTAATIAYGYMMKPLGLVVATAALVYISAFGGHEFSWKEVTILFVILIVMSVVVFVKGLTLPFPICPDFIANCPIR
jgi:hypothetical protein